VRLPSDASAGDLSARLDGVRKDLGLEALTVQGVDELASARPAASHILSVYGADHPGIVAAMSAVLSRLGANITDLETRLTGSEEAPLYVMLMEVALGDADAAELERELREAASAAGVEVTLRELDAAAL
jgi:glycine cleavage system transcriptional repressor